MIITKEIIEAGKSLNGAWSKAQLKALNVPIKKGFKLEKGWKKRLIGSDVSEVNVKLFLDLKDKHLGKLQRLIKKKQETATKKRRQRSLAIMKKYGDKYSCSECFHRKTKSYTDDLPNGGTL